MGQHMLEELGCYLNERAGLGQEYQDIPKFSVKHGHETPPTEEFLLVSVYLHLPLLLSFLLLVFLPLLTFVYILKPEVVHRMRRQEGTWEIDFYTAPVLEVLLFSTIRRQWCIKLLRPKDHEFYTPLELNCQKWQRLPALNQSQSPRQTVHSRGLAGAPKSHNSLPAAVILKFTAPRKIRAL